MADVNIDGNAVEAIFMQAINSIPFGGQIIAKMIKSNHRGKPLSNQQLFKKTIKSMKNMDVGKEDTILKAATQAYLHKNFNLPACDISAYELKVKNGNITLKYNPKNPKTIPLTFWANKRQNETISQARPERKYTPLTEKETKERLTENIRWLEQKKVYKERLVKMFGANSQQLSEIFKDSVPGRADFSGCEIKNFDFSKYNLSGADFGGAHLINCTFRKAEQSDFTNSVIDGCIFAGASLAASDFGKAIIKSSSFDNANLRGANYNAAEPNDVTFRDAVFKDTSLDFEKPQNIVFDSVRKPGRPRKEETAEAEHRPSKIPSKSKVKSEEKSVPKSVSAVSTHSADKGHPKKPIKPVEQNYDCTIQM